MEQHMPNKVIYEPNFTEEECNRYFKMQKETVHCISFFILIHRLLNQPNTKLNEQRPKK